MTKSLKGLRVLNTRPKEQAQELSHSIQEAGGQVIELPALAIEYLSFQQPAIEKLHTAIFTSANAVHAYFKKTALPWPKKTQVIAIGLGTAHALKTYQIAVHAMPAVADSEHLLALAELQNIQHQHILLVKGAGGRVLIADQLKKKGANLQITMVYRRVMPTFNPQWVKSIWQDDLVDIILLTSEQSIHQLLKIFDEGANWLQQKPCLVLSPRLAQAAALLGMQQLVCARPNELMQALLNYVNKD